MAFTQKYSDVIVVTLCMMHNVTNLTKGLTYELVL
jgi:hypothetical protein